MPIPTPPITKHQHQAVPTLNALHDRLEEHTHLVPPQLALGNAMVERKRALRVLQETVY